MTVLHILDMTMKKRDMKLFTKLPNVVIIEVFVLINHSNKYVFM